MWCLGGEKRGNNNPHSTRRKVWGECWNCNYRSIIKWLAGCAMARNKVALWERRPPGSILGCVCAREREAPSGRIADGYMKAAAPQPARADKWNASMPTAKLSARPNQASDFVIAARGRKSEFSALLLFSARPRDDVEFQLECPPNAVGFVLQLKNLLWALLMASPQWLKLRLRKLVIHVICIIWVQ